MPSMPSNGGNPPRRVRVTPLDRALDWIQDILKNISLIQTLVRGETFESFAANVERTYAVEFALVVISEASRRLPNEILVRHRDIPWRKVKGLRDVITHEYHGIDLLRVWHTATKELEALKRAMSSENRKRLRGKPRPD